MHTIIRVFFFFRRNDYTLPLNKTACRTEAEDGIKQNDACVTDCRSETELQGGNRWRDVQVNRVSTANTLRREENISYFREPVGQYVFRSM
jgi:hypothetical protein